MSLLHARRIGFDKKKDDCMKRSGRLGLVLALGLAVLLSLQAVSFSVFAPENSLTLDEALLEAKAELPPVQVILETPEVYFWTSRLLISGDLHGNYPANECTTCDKCPPVRSGKDLVREGPE